MIFDQPEVRCKNGHLIVANATVEMKPDGRGGEYEIIQKTSIAGKVLTNSRIVCEECARAAGGVITRRLTALKGRALETVGQQTVAETMGEIPMLYIK